MWHTVYADVINPNTVEGAILYAIVALVIAIVAARLVRAWSHQLGSHPRLFIDRTAASFLGQLLQVACFLIAATFYAHLIPLFHKLGNALLASASIVSLILGLAAQSTLGNLIAGIALLLYRPFAIGDVLVVNAPTGKEIGTVRDFTKQRDDLDGDHQRTRRQEQGHARALNNGASDALQDERPWRYGSVEGVPQVHEG
jgi:small conductance mechanosensitive channel